MNSETSTQKLQLRRAVRERLQSLPPEDRQRASIDACQLLSGQGIWKSARSVLFYAALADEIDLRSLIPEALRAGKTVALPRCVTGTDAYAACQIHDPGADLAPGRFGIPEPRAHCVPVSLNTLDLALVPGIAFDALGRRLGRGRGFYDRLLAQTAGTRCGVAFDEQMVGAVPVEPHDVVLNCILTPTRWLNIAGPARGS